MKLVVLFIAALVIVGISQSSYLLTSIALLTGMLFFLLAGSSDEREKAIREKASQMAYAIFAPTIGIGTFLLFFPSYSGISVFSKGEFTYLESLGTIFAYLTLFLIAIYAISYHFLNRKYGGGGDEK